MGERLNPFINNLNDHELAVYVGYQYESFLPHVREKVQNEIESRNLTKKQLEKYLNTKLSHPKGGKYCEMCGSNRFIKDIDIEHRGGSEVEIKTNRCQLCNHNPSKAPERNIFKRIKRSFVDKNKTTKTLKKYYWLDDKPHYGSD